MKIATSHLYTDGACSGNPGPGGWGFVLVNSRTQQVTEGGGFESGTTNNRMEMTAIIEGLRQARLESVSELLILTDSVYVIRGFTQWRFGWKKRGWKTQEGNPVLNQDLWETLDKVAQGMKLEWKYVRGHQGTPGNERVDTIAVAFSQRQSLHLYLGVPATNYIFDVSELPSGEPLPEMNRSSSASQTKKSFYISFVNGVLSRHEDWAACERTVKGQSKALYKKVSSEQELQEVLKKWGVNGN